MPQFVYQRRVTFPETDLAGIVHFSNYYKYMEEAEHAFYRELDLKIVHHNDGEATIGWPRVSAQCQYLAPMHYDDVIDIHVDIERIGMKSITWKMEFWKQDKCVARGKMKSACCRCFPDGHLESIVIPPPFSERFKESDSTETSS